MWSLWRDGEELRADSLTIRQLLEVEQRAGAELHELRPTSNARHAKALAEAFNIPPGEVRLADFVRSERDLPSYFEDGVPHGGRPFDSWIAAGVRLGFTPEQIRHEFTLRDLELISAAMS